MDQRSTRFTLDGMILFIAFVLANLRASIFIYLHPDPSVLFGPAWIEIALWFLITVVAVSSLLRDNQMTLYLKVVRKNWLVILFLLLGFVSIFWSVDPTVTLFRALELSFATFIAGYMGVRYRPAQWLDFLFWFGAILLILSVAVVFAAPKTGTMYWRPFEGAWRGVFWHRNHFSSMAALLSVVFLCRGLFALEQRNSAGLLDGFFYLLSIAVLYFAESATAYLLFILLHFLVFCSWIWLKVHDRLRPWHYYLILGIFVAGLVLALSNLDLIFGLFNRNTTLTGRTNLWNALVNGVVPLRPGWGYGLGAFWTVESFREEVRKQSGWPSQPLIADNGYLDILVHLGLAGLALLLLIVSVAVVRSFRYAITRKTLADFFPLWFMFYALIANIPFSLFVETEVFVWLLMVAVLFRTKPDLSYVDAKGGAIAPDQKPPDVNASASRLSLSFSKNGITS